MADPYNRYGAGADRGNLLRPNPNFIKHNRLLLNPPNMPLFSITHTSLRSKLGFAVYYSLETETALHALISFYLLRIKT
jgi:hypothetical protein